MYKKIAIYLMALIGTLGLTLVSPVMAAFAADFPNTSASTIGMVVTTPAITLLAGMFITTALTSKTDRKNIITFALILVILGGVAPAFLNSIVLILVCRAVLGLGMGLILPLQATYIAEYPEEKRPGLFGASQAICNLIGAAMLMIVSAFSKTGWRTVFLLYGVFVIIFILEIAAIPKSEIIRRETPVSPDATGQAAGPAIRNYKKWLTLFCISLFLTMTGQAAVMSSVSLYIQRYGLGGGAEAGMITSVGTLFLVAGSLAVPALLKAFKEWLNPVILFATALAFILYAFPVNIWSTGLGYALIFSLIALYSLNLSIMITQVMPLAKVALSMSITTSAIFVGQFISPYLQLGLASILGAQSTDSIVNIGFAAIFIVVGILNMPFKKKAVHPNSNYVQNA